jgi:hypothetical protein
MAVFHRPWGSSLVVAVNPSGVQLWKYERRKIGLPFEVLAVVGQRTHPATSPLVGPPPPENVPATWVAWDR